MQNVKKKVRSLKKRVLAIGLACSLAFSVIPMSAPVIAAESEPVNIAYGKEVTAAAFMEANPEELDRITDGVIDKDPMGQIAFRYHTGSEAEDTEKKPWVQIDLGKNYKIDTIKYVGPIPNDYPGYYSVSHNMVVQISQDENFEDDTTKTVFNSDAGNFFGLGEGTDTDMKNVMEGQDITFEPTEARYVRYYQHGMSQLPNPGANFAPNALAATEIAVYNSNKFCVTFDFNDGTGAVQKSYVYEGGTLARPEDPVSPVLGQKFDKWTVDVAGGEEWDFSQPVTGEMTLVANWKTVGIHTVTFDSDGGTEVSPVQVTDGMKLERPENPEKEGFIFAGWRLNDEPYTFDEPVTGDITLKAVWVEEPTEGAVTVHAGLLNLVMDSHGKVTNLISTVDNTDYSTKEPDDRLRSLVSLVADYNIEEPTGVVYDEENSRLVFDFATIDAEAVIEMRDEGNYMALTLVDLKKPDKVSVQAILWGPLKTSINDGAISAGVAYDDKFAIGMHMLNTKTIGGWPIEFKDEFYPSDLPSDQVRKGPEVDYSNSAAFSTWGGQISGYTWDYTQETERTIYFGSEVAQTIPELTGYHADEDASMIGSSVGLYGTKVNNTLNVISNIQLTEGLPHPTIDGEWQRTSMKTGQDFLSFL